MASSVTRNKILLATGSVFAALLVAELVLRALGQLPAPSIPDPELAWRYAPHARYRFATEGFSEGRFNSDGWRDHEFEEDRPDGGLRVALLGDSYLEGFGVDLEETFAKQTESVLRDDYGVSVQLMNFGRSGMGTVEELMVWENDAVRFSPDVVCLFFLADNDIEDALPETTSNPSRPFAEFEADALFIDTSFRDSRGYRMRERINPLKRRSALVSVLIRSVNMWRLRRAEKDQRKAQHDGKPHLSPFETLFSDQPDPTLQRGLAVNLRVLDTIAASCQKRSVGFLLVALPSMLHADDRELADRGLHRYSLEDQLQAWSREHSIPFLGLGRPLRRRVVESGSELCFRVGGRYGHFNEAGHGAVADQLAQFLAAQLDLGAKSGER